MSEKQDVANLLGGIHQPAYSGGRFDAVNSTRSEVRAWSPARANQMRISRAATERSWSAGADRQRDSGESSFRRIRLALNQSSDSTTNAEAP
jgi:hypothetical protein